jgi:hypothetical protein
MGAVEAIPAGLLPGDYSTDGVVDAADYTSWRDQLGWSVTPGTGADGNGDGQVDEQDYEVWASNFGLRLPVGGGAGEPGTPEALVEPVAHGNGAVTSSPPPALPGENAAKFALFSRAQMIRPAEPGAGGWLRRHAQIQTATRQDQLLEAWLAARDARKSRTALAEPVAHEADDADDVATSAIDAALESFVNKAFSSSLSAAR